MEDTGTIHHFGPWQIPYRATGVMCPDGRRRTIKLHHTPDTWFSIPGRVSYRGTTVTGFVTSVSDADPDAGLEFIPYKYLKNGHLFEEVS